MPKDLKVLARYTLIWFLQSSITSFWASLSISTGNARAEAVATMRAMFEMNLVKCIFPIYSAGLEMEMRCAMSRLQLLKRANRRYIRKSLSEFDASGKWEAFEWED